ncbi:MAG: InlB B-repeat-containing protein, partial [Promethearchaeota archaeon]
VTSTYGTPSGGGWFSSGANGNASLNTDTVAGTPGTQYVFTNWAGDGSGTNYALSNNVLMDSNKTISAVWKTQYYLTVESVHGTPSGEGWHASGTNGVAVVDSGTVSGGAGIQYVFASWSGDATGTTYSGSNNILMDAPKTATATWTTQYYLTVTSAYGTPSGSGWYDSGTNQVAAVDSGTQSGGAGIQYVFASWSGDATGSTYSGSNNILMDAPKTATATWTTQYYLTVSSAYGTPSGEGWYDAGTNQVAAVDSGTVSGGAGIQY